MTDYLDSFTQQDAINRLNKGGISPFSKCSVWAGNDKKQMMELDYLRQRASGMTNDVIVHGTAAIPKNKTDYDDSFTPEMAKKALANPGDTNPILKSIKVHSGNEWIETKLYLFLTMRAHGASCLEIIHSIHNARENDIWHGAANILKDTLKFIADIPKQIMDALAWVVLSPFKGAMKHALDNRKIKHSNELDDIADRFFRFVIKKEAYSGNFERDRDHFAAAIPIIIQAIIEFFKKIKDKGVAGKPLTDEEKKLLQMANDASKDAEKLIVAAAKKKADEIARKNGKATIFDGDNKLVMIIAVIVLIMIFKK